MMAWRLLNLQGAIGIAVSLALGVLLLVQKGETRHWRKQSGQYERQWKAEASAHQKTAGSYQAAALARADADARNIARVRAEQKAISERSLHDFQSRLADARAAADRLRRGAVQAPADPGGAGSPSVPAAGAAAGRADGAAAQDGFPLADRLIATEQAIQLQALIDWIASQARIDHDGADAKGDKR